MSFSLSPFSSSTAITASIIGGGPQRKAWRLPGISYIEFDLFAVLFPAAVPENNFNTCFHGKTRERIGQPGQLFPENGMDGIGQYSLLLQVQRSTAE